MDQELKPKAHQLCLSASCLSIQILVHSEQLCCLSNEKDSIKARRSPFTPIHFIL